MQAYIQRHRLDVERKDLLTNTQLLTHKYIRTEKTCNREVFSVSEKTSVSVSEKPSVHRWHNTQINLNKKARGTLDLPQTSRANPVQCYSTPQEKVADDGIH